MQPRYWLAFAVAAFGFATGGLATRAAFEQGVDAWEMVTLRIVIAAALVIVLLAFQRRLFFPDRLTLRIGIVMSIFNLAVPYVLFTLAYDRASAGFVSLLAALIPVATALFANAMLPNEPLTGAKVAGLTVGFLGVGALLFSGDSGLESGGEPVTAIILAMFGVASIGFAGVYAKKYAGSYEPTQVTGLQFGFAGLLLIVAMLAIEGPPADINTSGWLLILYMGIVGSFLPFYLFYRLIRLVPATTLSLIGYMVPLVALVGGVLLLDERIQPGMLVGGALILIGVILTDRADRRAALQIRA